MEENTEIKEETQATEKQVSENPADNLSQVLKSFPDAPDQAQIDAWKKQYRDIFVSGFSETEIFIWRTVRRPEFVEMQTRLNDPNDPMDNWKIEEWVCSKCVLWSSTKEAWEEGKAGTPQTLSEQIMQNSNFMSPQAASVLVAKL